MKDIFEKIINLKFVKILIFIAVSPFLPIMALQGKFTVSGVTDIWMNFLYAIIIDVVLWGVLVLLYFLNKRDK